MSLFAEIDPAMALFVMVVFFLAGVIKGVVGFGMPLFAITVLSLVMPLSFAIATNVGPSLVSNVVQAVRGPYFVALLKRLWLFLVPAIGLIWFGISIQVQVDPAYPGLVLGVLAVVFALVSFARLQPSIPPHREKLIGVLIGSINGIVTGLTGIFIIPGGLYLQALGLKRDELVQALGVLFMFSTFAIGVIFTIRSLMTPGLAVLSVLAILPGLIGMRLGEALRKRLSEELFRVLFLSGIGVIGLSLIVRNGLALVG